MMAPEVERALRARLEHALRSDLEHTGSLLTRVVCACWLAAPEAGDGDGVVNVSESLGDAYYFLAELDCVLDPDELTNWIIMVGEVEPSGGGVS